MVFAFSKLLSTSSNNEKLYILKRQKHKRKNIQYKHVYHLDKIYLVNSKSLITTLCNTFVRCEKLKEEQKIPMVKYLSLP